MSDGSATILLSGPDTIHRRASAQILREAGFTVYVFSRCEDLPVDIGQSIDLVILEPDFPSNQRISVRQHLQAIPPPLVLSLVPEDAPDEQPGLADATLRTPITPQTLLTMTRTLLRLRRAEMALATAQRGDQERARALVAANLQLRQEIAERRQAEAALREREKLYEALVDALPVSLYRIDREGGVVFANHTLLQSLGATLEEVIGKTAYDFYPPELATKYRADDAYVMRTGQTLRLIEEQIPPTSGERRFVEVIKLPTRNDDGTITGIQGIFWDVTSRAVMEEALRTSEGKLREAQAQAHIGHWEWNITRQELSWSEEVYHIFGVDPATFQVTVESFEQAIHPDDRPAFIKRRHHMLQNKTEVVIEHRIIRPDGVLRFVIERANVVHNADGNPVRVFGTVQDITPFKDVELRLQRRNHELDLLNRVIAASAGALDPESILDSVCCELAIFFDVPHAHATLLDRTGTMLRVVAEYQHAPYPSVLHRAGTITESPVIQELRTRKKPLVINEAQADGRFPQVLAQARRRGTATLLILPLWMNGNLAGSITLETTSPRHFSSDEVLLAESVTSQVGAALARAHLSQEQRLLSAAVEQAGESVVITDTNARILYVSPAFEQVTGYTRAEALGQNPRILQSKRHDPAFYQQLWDTIVAGQIWRGRFINRRKDGTLYVEDATIGPVRDHNGAIAHYVAVKRDVSRELRLEEQLRQMQKMEAVGRLAGGVAHDFNNLLSIINGYADLLLDLHTETDPERQDLEAIRQAGERAVRVTRQLLAFSRKQTLQIDVLNLNLVIADMKQLLHRLIGEDIGIVTRLDPKLGMVRADRGQMEQVILNLAVNARDAMPDGGLLTFTTSNLTPDIDEELPPRLSRGAYVRLEVSDTGVGMDSETRAHAFEPFFTTKETGKGTGLGLATIYGIITQSGGSIEISSEPNHGTTFHIYLPQVTVEQSAPSTEPAPAPKHHGTETILVVEDEQAIRSWVVRVLRNNGYQVFEASDGGAALHLCNTGHFPIHLLLSDIVLPGLSGLELARQLQQSRPDLKLLFMSGYVYTTLDARRQTPPGAVHIQKPFSPAQLLHAIRNLLDE